MQKRYARLRDDWMLRGWTDLPFAAANWKTGETRPFDSTIAYVARACDGRTNFASPLFLPNHIAILNALIKYGVAEDCSADAPIADYQAFRKADNPFLRGIHWAVTGGCNLKCRHCYMEAPSRRYPDLTDEQAMAVIGQFERANVLQVNLTGGEPFTRKNLFGILEALRGRGIGVHQFYTNGLLVTADALNRIKDLGFNSSFCLSFDGCGAHDRMRGVPGIESTVLAAVERIREAGFPVIVTTCIDRASRGCLLPTYERLKTLDIQSWAVAPPFETGNWCSAESDLTLAEEVAAYGPILEIWHEDGMPFRLQLGALFNSQVDSVGEHKAGRRMSFTPDSHDCGVCRETPHLMCNGVLLPCHAFSGSSLQDSMPNLLDQDLSDVWTESGLKDAVGIRKGDLFQYNPECEDCGLFEHCGMGCRARALMATGRTTSRDPQFCQMWKDGHKQRLLDVVDCSKCPD